MQCLCDRVCSSVPVLGMVMSFGDALQVVLTDCEEAVLLNLRECAAANAAADKDRGNAVPGPTSSFFPSQACF